MADFSLPVKGSVVAVMPTQSECFVATFLFAVILGLSIPSVKRICVRCYPGLRHASIKRICVRCYPGLRHAFVKRFFIRSYPSVNATLH